MERTSIAEAAKEASAEKRLDAALGASLRVNTGQLSVLDSKNYYTYMSHRPNS